MLFENSVASYLVVEGQHVPFVIGESITVLFRQQLN